MIFDPMYFLYVAPAMLLAGWAQLRIKKAYAEASRYSPRSGVTGAQAAAHILDRYGLAGVGIEPTRGFLGDHYDPRAKVLRLSPDVYGGKSLAALGVAAHEAGHAIQDAKGYAPLVIRNGIVPLASVGGNLSMLLLFGGFLISSTQLVLLGVGLFSLVVIFQIINLPVEYDASARAKEILVSTGLISPQERGLVSKVLNAAALTYVAATLMAILQLVYYLSFVDDRG